MTGSVATGYKPGARIEYEISWLEMNERPFVKCPDVPARENVFIIHATRPDVWYLRSLYEAVGRDYAWDDIGSDEDDLLSGFLRHPSVEFYSMIRNGWPQGFFVLDAREKNECRLVYLGLVRQAIGRGLGRWLLCKAIKKAWRRDDIRRLTVQTCSLDHPRAMELYVSFGFRLIARKNAVRTIDRDLPEPPR